jgi:hypothetical protein
MLFVAANGEYRFSRVHTKESWGEILPVQYQSSIKRNGGVKLDKMDF